MRHAKMREISARVFFVKVSKSQDSMIYAIFSFFRIHIPKMDSFANVSVTRPGRPSDPPARHGSQVIKLVRVPVFLNSKLSQTGSCSNISQFKTESKWFVFQYFSVQN